MKIPADEDVIDFTLNTPAEPNVNLYKKNGLERVANLFNGFPRTYNFLLTKQKITRIKSRYMKLKALSRSLIKKIMFFFRFPNLFPKMNHF